MIRRASLFSAERWRGDDGLAEGSLMKAVFVTLVVASAAMLALDFGDMLQRAADAGIGTEQSEPVIVEPPSDGDRERPYFPRAMPMAPGARPPVMPGLTPKSAPKMVAERMAFDIDDRGTVSAVGRIEPGTAADFAAFLKENNGKAKRIWLHSSGGALADALAIGRTIRKAKLDTAVPDNAYCASSCPLILAAGVNREAGKRTFIGVHQIYTLASERGSLQDGLANAQRISAECQDYLAEMGADPRLWIHAMKTAKHRLYIFTPEELADYKLVTKATSTNGV
jgi:hypothetical protein